MRASIATAAETVRNPAHNPVRRVAARDLNATPSGKNLARFRNALLRWYDRHRRDLPWRETRDPYRIWISEIMLQQTRVAAVLDHYQLFLQRFPNLHVLAAASEDEVLATWSGLGYYRRARMMHRCAQEIVERRGGCLPAQSDTLVSLPGIGRYTAAAIASIAFAEAISVVDGNVERVLQRFLGKRLTERESWQFAQALLDPSRPGDYNQAMMELGATVCIPREPRCLLCPIRKWCVARANVPDDAPRSIQKNKQIWCTLDCRDNHSGREVRLVQRPKENSLMAGMWELPQMPEPPPATAFTPWRTFRHSITITNYKVHVLRNADSQNRRLRANSAQGRWIAIQRIPEIPITGLTRKILKAGGII